MSKVYQYDTGVELIFETGQDLAEATKTSILVLKPDESEEEWVVNATGYSKTTITYVSASGDLDLDGTYYFQTYVEWGSDSHHKGESVSLDVYPEFQ